MSQGKPKILVVGGGLAGLWTTIRVAEAGYSAQVFSIVPVKRSHSVCAQGGMNACLDIKGEGDTVWDHIVDTIKGGDYIANQPVVKTMCEDAPGIVRIYDRMGVPFSRTAEGTIDQRLFGGVKNRRTTFAGASTGQQLLYACDEQVRRFEDEGLVEKFEGWEFLSIVKDDDGRCRGLVAMNLVTMETRVFPGDAVILATGGFGQVFGRSTNSTHNTGAAVARAYRQGAHFMNAEFIQIHPTGMLGHDKHRLMSEAVRGEGGRVWVPRDAADRRPPNDIPEDERFYFMEEWYPAYGNTVPRDVASRAIWSVVKEQGLGVDGEAMVYLDLTHKDPVRMRKRLDAILEIYEKYTGDDPLAAPMKVFPCVHYCMGGLWIGFEAGPDGGILRGSPKNHSTNIPGLYACGEADGAYHGANRLGANSLLSSSFAGMVTGDSVVSYVKALDSYAAEQPSALFETAEKREQDFNKSLLESDGGENAYQIHHELGNLIYDNMNVIRNNKDLDETMVKLKELEKRSHNLTLDDKSEHSNVSLAYARQVQDMIILGQILVKSARARDECRGAHFKREFHVPIPEGKFKGDPEFEEYVDQWKKNNEKWLKSTVAKHTDDGPEIEFKDVDLSILPADKPRDYR